jgi:hypothetical protein
MFERDPTVGSKVMTLSNRPSSLLQPDLIIIEYQFLIHSMEKGIRKLQEKFDRDPTVGSKVMAISKRHSSLGRPHLIITENRFLIRCMEKGPGNSSKSLIVIQRSDRKLLLFPTSTQAWYDQTSSSPRIDSSSTASKRASGNSTKSLSAIPLSDRKL